MKGMKTEIVFQLRIPSTETVLKQHTCIKTANIKVYTGARAGGKNSNVCPVEQWNVQYTTLMFAVLIRVLF